MNEVKLIGYVSFPKPGQTQSGVQKTACSVGIARRKKDPNAKAEYDNIRVVAYGEDTVKLTDNARVLVIGRITTYSFQDQQTGQKVKMTEVVANKVEVLQAVQRRQQGGYNQQGGPQVPPPGNNPFNKPQGATPYGAPPQQPPPQAPSQYQAPPPPQQPQGQMPPESEQLPF